MLRTEHSPANVLAAYEILLEEVEAEIEWVNELGGRAFASGDHSRAQELLGKVQKLTGLRRDLVAWGRSARLEVSEDTSEASGERLPHGLKTPEEAYRVPILRTLVEMGGSGETGQVLERVYELMKDQLNQHDLSPMPSNERNPRWRNTAQWCRNTMREEGLIESNSPRGVWEISQKGRRWLEAQR